MGRVHGATLSQALAQSAAPRTRATGLRAEPLIVYSRAWVDRPGARRKGVRVIPARMLVGYLAKREGALCERGNRGGRDADRGRAAGACQRQPGASCTSAGS